MDVEIVYSHGLYRIVLGFFDKKQEHFARIETDSTDPKVQWEYKASEKSLGFDVLGMLSHTQKAARSLTGIEYFEVDNYDMNQLIKAPHSRQVSPAELTHIEALDTDYLAGFDLYTAAIDEVLPELSDEQVETAESTALLRECVQTLYQLQQIENCELADLQHSYGTVEARKASTVAVTALELVTNCYGLATSMAIDSRAIADEIVSEQIPWQISDVFNEQEIAQIDSFTENLCGSQLSQFQKAVERGYDPTTGLPLDCQNPETFSWAQTVPNGAEALYIQNGMTEVNASRMIFVQQTDPRDRSDNDWNFLKSMTLYMNAVAEQNRSHHT